MKILTTGNSDAKGYNNISFHGFIAHGQVQKYIEAFDIVLVPCQKTIMVHGGGGNIGQWTSPLKLFEYIASKVDWLCA